jgi:hypothetical protein
LASSLPLAKEIDFVSKEGICVSTRRGIAPLYWEDTKEV